MACGASRTLIDDSTPPASATPFDPGQAMRWLREQLPRDAIVTFDAGAFSGWPQRFLSFGRPGRVIAPISGAMNYGLHAAIAASLVHPDRVVVACIGDGGFTMGEMELATARRYGARPSCFCSTMRSSAACACTRSAAIPAGASGWT